MRAYRIEMHMDALHYAFRTYNDESKKAEYKVERDNGRVKEYPYNPAVEDLCELITAKCFGKYNNFMRVYTGPPRSGKDLTMYNIFKNMFGQEKVVTLLSWNATQERFISDIIASQMTILTEEVLKKKGVLESLKAFTGAQVMRSEAKHKDAKSTVPHVSLVFTTNNPMVHDLEKFNRGVNWTYLGSGKNGEGILDEAPHIKDLSVENKNGEVVKGTSAYIEILSKESIEFAKMLRDVYSHKNLRDLLNKKQNPQDIVDKINSMSSLSSQFISTIGRIQKFKGEQDPDKIKNYLKYVSNLWELIINQPCIRDVSDNEIIELFKDRLPMNENKINVKDDAFRSPPFSAIMNDMLPVRCVSYILKKASANKNPSFEEYTEEFLVAEFTRQSLNMAKKPDGTYDTYRGSRYVKIPGLLSVIAKSEKLFEPDTIDDFRNAGSTLEKVRQINIKVKNFTEGHEVGSISEDNDWLKALEEANK